ncbi:MAG: hypothetical protein Q8O71_01695 [bacterium]|nr:hypothetical protein [bacterium]
MGSEPLRVHVGCGKIYLRGYRNVDLPAPNRHLASARPDLMERWITDDGDAYYARIPTTREEVSRGPLALTDTVVDDFADALHGLPFGVHQVDEVLARQVAEHWSMGELRKFVLNVDYVLKPGGVLRLDVPDMAAALDRIESAARDGANATELALMRRHVQGPRGGDGGDHFAGYARAQLRALVEEYGFEFVAEEPPLAGRWYPAFCLRWRKPLWSETDPTPWQRLLADTTIPDEWVCAEIGPGSRTFWPRANVIMDVIDRGLDDRPRDSTFHQGDLCAGYPEIATQSIDYLVASHIIEHVAEPLAAIAEINRIAKRGVIECPSPFKECLFGFEGAGFDHTAYAGHEWWVWPERDGSGLVFQRPNSYFAPLADRDVAGAMHRILRMGPLIGPDAMILRRWFSRHHEHWNTIVRWDGALTARIIE